MNFNVVFYVGGSKRLVLPDPVLLAPTKFEIAVVAYHVNFSVKQAMRPVGILCNLIANNSYDNGKWIPVLEFFVPKTLGTDEGKPVNHRTFHRIVSADTPMISFTAKPSFGYVILQIREKK